MDDKIIPFGKHKGKPVEVLANDQQYLDWLLAQSWFREKHVNLYNVVINNFREPVDTLEHNKIQIKFLRPEYRIKLGYLANPNLFNTSSDKINEQMKKILESTERNEGEHFLKSLQNPNKESEFGLYDTRMLKYSKPIFERVDVHFSLWYGIRFYYDSMNYNGGWSEFRHETKTTYLVEIKPTISDDYPAVLRQMKASMPVRSNGWQSEYYFVLLVGEYSGTGATKEEFIDFFETQGYRVIFGKDLEAVNLPDFEREFKLDKEIEEIIKNSR